MSEIVSGQAAAACAKGSLWVDPCGLLQGTEVGDHGICRDPIGNRTPGDALGR